MQALVLGGTGFIGSYVVDQLRIRGHRVRVFSRSEEHSRPPLPDVDYRQADFGDLAALGDALRGVDVVFHLISTTVPSTSNLDPVFDIESNLVATVRLLQAMLDAGVGKIVYLSSGGTVYGVPEKLPIPEDHPLKPICSYGVVKVAVENYLHMFRELHGLDYTILRASNPYGERQGHSGIQGVIAAFLHKAGKGEELEIWGDGSLVRDFIYVEDLARLCVAAGESAKVGVYNAGSGVGASINEIVSFVERAAGRKLTVQRRESRNFDVPKVVLDIGRASREFGWHPEVDLAEGIKMTWQMLAGASGKGVEPD